MISFWALFVFAILVWMGLRCSRCGHYGGSCWKSGGTLVALTVINHQSLCLSENFSYLCKVLGQVSNNILVTKQLESIRYIR